MASLKLDIIPDLKQFSKAVADVIRQKIKEVSGGSSGGGGSADKEPKKQTSLLTKILSRLGLLSLLLSLKPITDLLSIVASFAVLGFFTLVKYFKNIINFLDNIGNNLASIIKGVAEAASNVAASFATGLVELWTNVLGGLGQIVAWLIKLPSLIWDFLKELPAKIWSFVSGLGGIIWDYLRTGFDNVVSWLGGLPEKIWSFVKDLGGVIWGFLKDLPSLFWELMKDGFNWVKDVVTNVWDAIKDLPSKIWNFLKDLPSLIANALKSLGSGIVSFFSGSSTKVGDAILRPNGQVIKTDPQDTLFAIKNPGMGSNPTGGGGTTIMNFYGVTPQQVVDLVMKQSGQQSLRRTRL